MRRLYKLLLGMVAVLVVLLCYRFVSWVKLPNIDGEFHADYIHNIEETQGAISGLRVEMLRIQNGQRKFYDLLELELKEVQRHLAVLAITPEFVRDKNTLNAIARLATESQENAALLDTEVQLFKQYFSLLQNSRTYLPLLAKKLRLQAQAWPQYEAAIGDLVYRVMESTYLSSGRLSREAIVDQAQQLIDNKPAELEVAALWMLKAHVEIALRYDHELNLTSSRIDASLLPQLVASSIDIERLYRAEYERAQAEIRSLEILGLGIACVLFVSLMLMFASYLVSRRKLQALSQKESIQGEINAQLDQLVQQKTASLQQANEELSQFGYRASHDLKSPLVAITALAECILLDLDCGDVEEATANTHKVIDCSERLSRLVTDIMELSRADLADEVEQTVDIARLFATLELSMVSAENAARVELLLSDESREAFVSQPRRLQQVIYNLLSNGFKYANLQRESCFVALKFAEVNGAMQLEISDNGVGIPEKFQDRLFQRFQRFHPELAEGSGLGMSIVKSHIDRLGASVEFSSSDQGTRYTVRFPARQALAAAA